MPKKQDPNSEPSNWASKFNITHIALRELLKILHPFHDSLPKDPRTLMQTKSNIPIVDIEGGHYHHFGLENSIRYQLSEVSVEKFTSQQETIQIQLNIDGIPMFKSSKLNSGQFWEELLIHLHISLSSLAFCRG